MATPDVDAVHTYHGFRRPGAVCRLRIYRPPGSPPPEWRRLTREQAEALIGGPLE